MNKKMLITGCCGFVGRHFCKFFSNEYEITGVDNMSSESSLYPDQWQDRLKCDFNFIEEDIIEFLNKNETKYDIVIHLAAIVGGRAKIEESPLDVATDLIIDSHVIKWCSDKKVDRLVFFSSSAVYPVKHQMDNDEKIKLNESLLDYDNNIGLPDLTYGWAKMTGEYLCKIAHQNTGLNVISYRPFSGYGEDQNTAYPFPAIMKRIINKEDPLVIWSDSIRDFVYIDDIVEYVNNTMYTINDGSSLNIGTSIPTSFSELAKIASNIYGYNPEIKVLNDKPKGVYYRVSESKIEYKFSIEDGIKKTLKYHDNTFNN
jgi:nucleoside-diphosphate-sugar epimerase